MPSTKIISRKIDLASDSEGISSLDNDILEPSPKRRRISTDDELINLPHTYPAQSRVRNTIHTIVPTDEEKTGALRAEGLSVNTTDTDFASIDVSPWLVHSLRRMEIHHPTEIQRSCIPEIMRGSDCIGGSRTGTGKTVAFAVPILQKWSADPHGIYALVLTPTRELALQMYEQFTVLGLPQALKTVLVTGGSDMRSQAQALAQRPHVVIATPGRLADHVENSGEETIKGLRRVKMVVFDEADRLLSASAGMLPDINTCLSTMPASSERQTLLFTATITPEVRALKDQPRSKDRPPLFVSEIKDYLDSNSTEDGKMMVPGRLNQTYLQVPPTHKDAFLYILLLHLLTTEADAATKTANGQQNQIIVFTNRTKTTDLLHRTLHKLFADTHQSSDPSHTSIAHLKATIVTSLSSALPQSQRAANLSAFRASTARVLISTDLSSRGLDIPTCTHVINYDLPRNPVDYVHRVGRTARAGRRGTSVTFVGPRDVELLLAVEEYVGKKMDGWKAEGDEEVNIETRVVRGRTLKDVGEARMDALRDAEGGKDIKGYRGKIRKKR